MEYNDDCYKQNTHITNSSTNIDRQIVIIQQQNAMQTKWGNV